MIGKIFKVALSLMLLVSGITILGTIFTAKGIDAVGDKLEDKLHG
ncbi:MULTISPECIES: hypothetical protein [Weissella]|jgi:hypothetical protein|uniref:Uncharacterized protein n=2 Tax=Weissella TaxID=46255 RepID=A0ABY0K1G9_WEIHE|nr:MULTISPECIES: hypothetical protein [Weissella]GED36285.1 hypothetical protein WHE01_11890 [Weissella hellenica]SCB97658.1 hypothetical protein GA0061075_10926 [Weissella hellenica]